MNRLLRGYSFSFFLSFLLPFILSEASFSQADPLWREGGTIEADPDLERLSRAFERLADKVRPGVVQIRANRKAPADPDSGSQRPSNSRGSGFIINSDGYVLTAHHVIEGAAEIEILFNDRRRLRAQLVAAERQVDVALLKVGGKDLPVLALGDSNGLKVGELVASLSYPFGLESSLSFGIISRRGRSQNVLAGFDFIQTSAGASAGSSGGPLVNIRGEVVGMVTMASQSGSMGFAVPISVIKNVLPRLEKGEKIIWGWLGVRLSELTLDAADKLGLSPVRGVLVNSLLPGQPAEKGKVLPQDVILAVNEVEVDNPRELTRLIGGTESGSEVQLTIFRKGEILQRSVILTPKPKETEGREG